MTRTGQHPDKVKTALRVLRAAYGVAPLLFAVFSYLAFSNLTGEAGYVIGALMAVNIVPFSWAGWRFARFREPEKGVMLLLSLTNRLVALLIAAIGVCSFVVGTLAYFRQEMQVVVMSLIIAGSYVLLASVMWSMLDLLDEEEK